MHRKCIAAHIIRFFGASLHMVRVVFVRGEQALLVSAVRAADEHGFVPEAHGGAEGITLARREVLFAFFADIFFFGGVLCGYHRCNAEPKKKQEDTCYHNGYCKRTHIDLLVW